MTEMSLTSPAPRLFTINSGSKIIITNAARIIDAVT